MGFMKKQSAGFYLEVCAILVGAAGLIRYFANCRTAYFSNLGQDPRVTGCFIAAIVLELVYVAGNEILGDRMIFDLCPPAAAVLLTVGTLFFISARVDGIAAIMTFTNNASTMADLNHTITSVIVCGAAMLITILASFFRVVKEQ